MPSKFRFERVDDKPNDIYSGSYLFVGFGFNENAQVKLSTKIDKMQGFTPMWKKIEETDNKSGGTVSDYFICFNQERSRWELNETLRHIHFSVTHLTCTTGSYNQTSLDDCES